jgi:hypothetical protein
MERARRFQSAMFQPTDEASCFDATISFWDYTVVHNAALEATGLMEFNPELASACLTEFNALRCDEWLSASGYLGYSSPIASCAAVFRGLVPVGGDCTLGGDYLCESGHCDIIGTKTCLASAGPGEACLQETGMPLRCRAGLACLPPEPTTCQALPLAERECNGI